MAMSKNSNRHVYLANRKNKKLIGISILATLIVVTMLPFKNTLFSKFTRADGGAAQQTALFSTTTDADWATLLVNRWHPLPENSQPELVTLENGERIDKKISEPLQKMLDAAKAEGVFPIVASGYRSSVQQQELLDNKIEEYKKAGNSRQQAKEKAEKWVALPGTSEHQLGIAVDINEDKWRSSAADVYNWLQVNAHKFGFIYRYPSDKTEITGVINEPWHYRYVGIGPATEIYQKGLCLEEYLGG